MKGKLLAFGVSLLAMATIGVVQLQIKAVDSSRDCDQYAVIRCGTLNGDELRAEFESNNTAGANGYTTEQGDIKKIFNSMGITKAELTGFKPGIVYKNGNVEVDGKVVATDAMMAARGLGGTQITGTNAQKVSVSAMGDAQTAMVKLDQNGKFLFAVMKPCGNPVTATPKRQPTPEPQPQPVAKCVDATVTQQQERTKYLVKVTASVKDGAKIKGYTIKLTNGSTVVVDKTYPSTSNTQSVVYVIEAPGEYKVKATVDTSEGVKGGPDCEATFTVPKPPVVITETPTPGVDITKFVNSDKKYALVNTNVEFNYTIAVKNTGNTDLDNVVVTDTPDRGVTLTSVTPPSGTITRNVFTYTIPKLLKGETRTFVLTAKVPQAQAGRIVNTVCVDAPAVTGNPDKCDKAEVEVPPTPVPGKLEVCVLNEKVVRMIDEAEVKANPTLYSTNLSLCAKEDKAEALPAELPATGTTETVLSIIGAMSLVGASAYYVASRRTV